MLSDRESFVYNKIITYQSSLDGMKKKPHQLLRLPTTNFAVNNDRKKVIVISKVAQRKNNE